MSRYDEFIDEVRRTRSERTYVNYCDALRCFPEGNKEEVLEYIERTDIAGSTKKLRLTILRQALLYIGGMTQDIMRLIRGYKPNEAVVCFDNKAIVPPTKVNFINQYLNIDKET